MIHLGQSILETKRISQLHGSPLFTIPLKSNNMGSLNAPKIVKFHIKRINT